MKKPVPDAEVIALLDRLTESGWMDGYIHNADGGLDIRWTDNGMKSVERFWGIVSDAGVDDSQPQRLAALHWLAFLECAE